MIDVITIQVGPGWFESPGVYRFQDTHSIVSYDFDEMKVWDDDSEDDLVVVNGELEVDCGFFSEPVADYHGAQVAYEQYLKDRGEA